jgi:hypothetical protein
MANSPRQTPSPRQGPEPTETSESPFYAALLEGLEQRLGRH